MANIRPIMLYGPPGTGKTTAVEVIARALGRELIYVSGGDFGNEYKNSEQAYLKKFFDEEIKKSGGKVIVFIDEIDALARSGNAQSHESTNQRYTAFMKYLDQIQNDENIFIIAATNNPDVIAPAVINRFELIKVDLPDYNTRWNAIERAINRGLIIVAHNLGRNFINEDLRMLTILSKGFSFRDIEAFVNNGIINFKENFPIEQPFKKMNTLKSRIFQFQSPGICVLHWAGVLGTPLYYLIDKILKADFEAHIYSSFCKQREQVEKGNHALKNAPLAQASGVGAGIGGLAGFCFGGLPGAAYGAGIGGTISYKGMQLYLDGN